jgi:hypothetical protein
MCAHSAVAPFVHDQTWTIVSRCQGAPVSLRAVPPQRSTTLRPPAITETAAPSSPRSLKFRMNSSRTRLKRSAQTPETGLPAGSFTRLLSSSHAIAACARETCSSGAATAPAAAPSSRRRRARSTVRSGWAAAFAVASFGSMACSLRGGGETIY